MELSFETQIALQRLLVPSLIAFVGAFLMSRSMFRSPTAPTGSGPRLALRPLAGALLIGLALIVSDLWQRGILADPTAWRAWSAREPWMWMVWMIPAIIVVLAAMEYFLRLRDFSGGAGSPIRVALAAAAMLVVLPQGAGYEDQLGNAVRWVAFGTVASIWNASAIDGIATHDGARWAPCVLLAQLGGIAAMVLQSYASLGEWVLAGIGVTLGVCLVALIFPSAASSEVGWSLSPAVQGLVILACASVAVSTFYASTPQPNLLVASILLLPTLVGWVDCGVRRWNPWYRALIAAAISGILIGIVVFLAIQQQPEW